MRFLAKQSENLYFFSFFSNFNVSFELFNSFWHFHATTKVFNFFFKLFVANYYYFLYIFFKSSINKESKVSLDRRRACVYGKGGRRVIKKLLTSVVSIHKYFLLTNFVLGPWKALFDASRLWNHNNHHFIILLKTARDSIVTFFLFVVFFLGAFDGDSLVWNVLCNLFFPIAAATPKKLRNTVSPLVWFNKKKK